MALSVSSFSFFFLGCVCSTFGTNSQEKLHAACSALHFEPVGDDVEWRIVTGAAIRPTITVSPVNDELLAAVGKLTAEYGRIGGNLNQIARTLNEWHSPYPQLAGEVRAAVSDLAALKFEVLQKVGDAVGNIQTYQL